MTESKRVENLKKLTLIELKEIQHRENLLLKNSKLIKLLPDKGISIQAFHDRVVEEIKYRENVRHIEDSMFTLSLTNNDTHDQRLCFIEKTTTKERYKPFATLNKIQDVKADSKIFKIMEDCSHCNTPTKLIPLPESIQILKSQDERIKEEQTKNRYARILDKLRDEENEEKSSDSEDDKSDSSAEDNEDEAS